MLRVIRFVLVAAIVSELGAGIAPSRALADHSEPAKGNRVTFALVNPFLECSSPNTATQTNGTPACAPPTPDGVCGFTSKGIGTLTLTRVGSATKGNQDLRITANATGLDASCENLHLSVMLSYRLTTDDCPEGSCTAVDAVDLITNATCIVMNGKCKINTTLNAANPGLIATSGKNAGIEVFGCRLGDLSLLFRGPRCGLLLK